MPGGALNWDRPHLQREHMRGIDYELRRHYAEPTERQLRAKEFVLNYTGSFGFLLDMREKARDGAWFPTEGQTDGIFNCIRREARENSEATKHNRAEADKRQRRTTEGRRSGHRARKIA